MNANGRPRVPGTYRGGRGAYSRGDDRGHRRPIRRLTAADPPTMSLLRTPNRTGSRLRAPALARR